MFKLQTNATRTRNMYVGAGMSAFAIGICMLIVALSNPLQMHTQCGRRDERISYKGHTLK
jgi:hypothetical protein